MSCVGDSILENYEGSNDDSNNNGTTSTYQGQSFQIPNNATVCGFSFYGGKGTVGTQPGTFKVEIKTGSVTGTVIATTGSVSTSGMNDYTSPQWNKIEFTTPVDLTAGTTYYLVVTSLTGSINDVTRMYVDTTSPSYSGGQWYSGTTAYPTRDLNFRIHGVEGAAGSVSCRGMFGLIEKA